VNPGVDGATVAWFVGVLSEEEVIGASLVTAVLVCDQVKGPTTPVMSTPLLKAFAWRVLIWFVDMHLLVVAVNDTAHANGMTCCPGQAGGGEVTGVTSVILMVSIGG
jgi:hypothetical protein